jgi:hypothetical protein
LTFSRDGARLAIGGGTWYGNGGIIVRALRDGTDVTLHWEDFRDNSILFPEPFSQPPCSARAPRD